MMLMFMFEGDRESKVRFTLRVCSIAATTVAFFGVAIMLGYLTAGRSVPHAFFVVCGVAAAVSWVFDFIAPKAK